jgi:hypothetical protein
MQANKSPQPTPRIAPGSSRSRGLFCVQFICSILLAASVCGTGCEMSADQTNPIPGWQVDFKTEPSPVVEKDYKDYIQKLPPDEKRSAHVSSWVKDGTGQHAIVIEVALNGTWWNHVLIYDKDDKRIKAVKYIAGHYAS